MWQRLRRGGLALLRLAGLGRATWVRPKGEQGCGLGEQAGCGLHGQLKQAEKREEKKTFSFYKT